MARLPPESRLSVGALIGRARQSEVGRALQHVENDPWLEGDIQEPARKAVHPLSVTGLLGNPKRRVIAVCLLVAGLVAETAGNFASLPS